MIPFQTYLSFACFVMSSYVFGILFDTIQFKHECETMEISTFTVTQRDIRDLSLVYLCDM